MIWFVYQYDNPYTQLFASWFIITRYSPGRIDRKEGPCDHSKWSPGHFSLRSLRSGFFISKIVWSDSIYRVYEPGWGRCMIPAMGLHASPHFSHTFRKIPTDCFPILYKSLVGLVSRTMSLLTFLQPRKTLSRTFPRECEKFGLARISHTPFEKFPQIVPRSCIKASSV